MHRYPAAPAFLALALTAFGCGGASFSGNAGGNKPRTSETLPAKKDTPVSDPTPVPPVTTTDCMTAPTTQATLLTASVQKSAANSVLQYQVSLTDCHGLPMPLAPQRLEFDLDMEFPRFAPVTYTVSTTSSATTAGNALAQTGSMQDIVGSDLFQHTGTQWAHWETDQIVNVSQNTGSLLLQIALPNIALVPRTGPANLLTTYLQYGDATVIAKTVQISN